MKRSTTDIDRFNALQRDLVKCVGLYSTGCRTSLVLNTLAQAHVYATSFGHCVNRPVHINRTEWDQILNNLVVERLGTHRCLECYGFFNIHAFPYDCCTCGSKLIELIGDISCMTK